MRFALRHRESHEQRTTRSLERAGMRAHAAEMDLDNRTPEGDVQS